MPAYGLVSMKRTLTYSNGWAAEIVYCLPQSAVDAHIADHYLAKYPGAAQLSVAQITDEPWMDGDAVQVGGMSMSRKLTYQFALDYLNVAWPDSITRPAYKAGTTLKLSVKFSGQYLIYPSSAFKPPAEYPSKNPDGTPYTPIPDNGPPSSNPDGSPYVPGTPYPGGPGGPGGKQAAAQDPPGKQQAILIPLRDYVIEWDRIQALDSMGLSSFIGKVNSETFLGAEAGTLLFEGHTLDHSAVLKPGNPHSYKIVVTFKQRRISVGGSIYGWNDEYRVSTKKWAAIVMANGDKAYQDIDFTDIFG